MFCIIIDGPTSYKALGYENLYKVSADKEKAHHGKMMVPFKAAWSVNSCSHYHLKMQVHFALLEALFSRALYQDLWTLRV
jgi:hypothetical protein